MHSNAAAEAISDDLQADLTAVLLHNQLDSMAPTLPALCINTIPALGTANMAQQATCLQHKKWALGRAASRKPAGSHLLSSPTHPVFSKENGSAHQNVSDSLVRCQTVSGPVEPMQSAQPVLGMQRKRFVDKHNDFTVVNIMFAVLNNQYY